VGSMELWMLNLLGKLFHDSPLALLVASELVT
jgi:hypothetical protein